MTDQVWNLIEVEGKWQCNDCLKQVEESTQPEYLNCEILEVEWYPDPLCRVRGPSTWRHTTENGRKLHRYVTQEHRKRLER